MAECNCENNSKYKKTESATCEEVTVLRERVLFPPPDWLGIDPSSGTAFRPTTPSLSDRTPRTSCFTSAPSAGLSSLLRARSDKLYRARSRLYRNQILQENMRWKALPKIYIMHSFAPFFNLKISAKNRQHFLRMNNEFPIFSFSTSKFAFFSANF